MSRSTKRKQVAGTKRFKFNFQDGCSHDCKYCYSKAKASRYGSGYLPCEWQNERIRRIDLASIIEKCDCEIIFPTSHDITPDNLDESIFYLRWLCSVSLDFIFVNSKPHFECIKRICDQFNGFQDRLFLRFTIGSTDSETLKFWEPNAPDFEERFKCLVYAYDAGYITGVRIEPMLDNKTENLIRMALPYITDGIYIGKPKSLLGRLYVNGFYDQKTTSQAIELLASLSDEYILRLYDEFKDIELVKWKNSIKKIVIKYRPSVSFFT